MKVLQTLFKTNDSFVPLIARLALGLAMFPHGAQKALGWFGGYGFSGTMGFFTGQLHIPALFAFLAITAEFANSAGMCNCPVKKPLERILHELGGEPKR